MKRVARARREYSKSVGIRYATRAPRMQRGRAAQRTESLRVDLASRRIASCKCYRAYIALCIPSEILGTRTGRQETCEAINPRQIEHREGAGSRNRGELITHYRGGTLKVESHDERLLARDRLDHSLSLSLSVSLQFHAFCSHHRQRWSAWRA